MMIMTITTTAIIPPITPPAIAPPLQERRKALKSGGPRALIGLICMAKIQFLWRSCIICGGHGPLGPPGSYAYAPLLPPLSPNKTHKIN